MEDTIASGLAISTIEVRTELERMEDDLTKWVRKFPEFFIDIDEDQQRIVRDILSNHRRSVQENKNRSGADPFVIALAKSRGLSVVTEETATNNPNKPKIPDVCKELGVECIDIFQFIRS